MCVYFMLDALDGCFRWCGTYLELKNFLLVNKWFLLLVREALHL